MSLDKIFPNLATEGYTVTSHQATTYNCIAWAAGAQNQWWWPDALGNYFWPNGVPREQTLAAFLKAFETLGYVPCADGNVEPDCEKVALYIKDGTPTHAARQLPNGRWTSKLGSDRDIEHGTKGLDGHFYGAIDQFLKRPKAKTP